MRINFLDAQEARAYFQEPDDYANQLPLSNLKMINPNNPSLEGYMSLFLSSFIDFEEEQKQRILSFTKYLPKMDLEIKMVRTKGNHALDITQTRKDVIVVTQDLGLVTFVHEVYHILSRKYPSITPELSAMFGYKQVNPQEIKDPKFLLNPDALICNYAIQISHEDEIFWVTPYIKLGLTTGLKIVDKDIYIDSDSTDYDLKIPNTTYLAHPEEVCAEYFALSFVGRCIFSSSFENEDKILEYKKQLLQILFDLKVLN